MEHMLSLHQFFTDHPTLALKARAEEKLAELQEKLGASEIQRREKEIRILRDGTMVAELLLEEDREEFFYGIHYYSQGKLVRTEYYTDTLSHGGIY